MKLKYFFIIAFLISVAIISPELFADGAEAAVDASSGDDVSLLGGLFHFVGEVVAFPFKLIGSALDGIF